MGCMFLTCTALNVPLFAHFRKYLICKLPDAFLKGEVGNMWLWNSMTFFFSFLVNSNSFSMIHVSDTLSDALWYCYIKFNGQDGSFCQYSTGTTIMWKMSSGGNELLKCYTVLVYINVYCHDHTVIFHNNVLIEDFIVSDLENSISKNFICWHKGPSLRLSVNLLFQVSF